MAVNIINTLANLSETDSWHDFHTDIPSIQKTIMNNRDIYISGLPNGITESFNFNDESNALSSVVTEINNDDSISDFSAYLVEGEEQNSDTSHPKPKNGITDSYTIKTINENEYSVKACVVAEKINGEKKYISAYDFIENLDIEDHSAIIVDAAAVSILEILTKDPDNEDQKKDINNKTIYFVITPEVINDPAGKTCLDENIFNNVNDKTGDSITGVNFISCESANPESFNYNYSYELNDITGDLLKNPEQSAYDKFFTSFNFQLSELQRSRKGQRTEYTTNLLITN